MAEAKELSIDDLRSLARKVDAGEAVEIPESPPDVIESSESSPEEVPEKTPSQDEIEKALGEGEPEEEQEPKSSDTAPEKSAELTKEEKEQKRYDRSWKKLQEEKAEVERQKKELAAEMAKTAKTRDLKDEQDDDGYSVKDYEYAKKKFEDEGNDELAREAESKAKSLYFQGFQKAWKANMDEMIDQYPDLSDSRKPFTITCDKVLKTLPFLQTIPDGCKYVVRIASGTPPQGWCLNSRRKTRNLKARSISSPKLRASVVHCRPDYQVEKPLTTFLPRNGWNICENWLKQPTGGSYDDLIPNERVKWLPTQQLL
jgi:myosin heavy subunit